MAVVSLACTRPPICNYLLKLFVHAEQVCMSYHPTPTKDHYYVLPTLFQIIAMNTIYYVRSYYFKKN